MSKKVWNGKIEKDEFIQLQESSAKIMGLNRVKKEANDGFEFSESVFVYFEGSGSAEIVAVFASEGVYYECSGELEKIGIDENGWESVTEGVDPVGLDQLIEAMPKESGSKIGYAVYVNKGTDGIPIAVFGEKEIMMRCMAGLEELYTDLKQVEISFDMNRSRKVSHRLEATGESVKKEAIHPIDMTKNFGVTIVAGVIFEHTGEGTEEKLSSLMGKIPEIESFETLFIQDEDDDGLVNATISIDLEVNKLEELSKLSQMFSKVGIEFVENK